jgi:hypothetical protein
MNFVRVAPMSMQRIFNCSKNRRRKNGGDTSVDERVGDTILGMGTVLFFRLAGTECVGEALPG